MKVKTGTFILPSWSVDTMISVVFMEIKIIECPPAVFRPGHADTVTSSPCADVVLPDGAFKDTD